MLEGILRIKFYIFNLPSCYVILFHLVTVQAYTLLTEMHKHGCVVGFEEDIVASIYVFF